MAADFLDPNQWLDPSTWIMGEAPQDAQQLMTSQPGYVWIKTSGSTHSAKWVGLSKHAMLESARAVNQHLQISPEDTWLCGLPTHHVGGLSIFARAALNGNRVQSETMRPWDPQVLSERLESHRIAWTSLVPTQIYDLVQKGFQSPASLKGVLVGGGAMKLETYTKARRLGWPILPTFGMTEAGSQVATTLPEEAGETNYQLKLLPHLQARTNEDGLLQLKGASLLSGYCLYQKGAWQFVDPKSEDGWWTSEDFVEILDDQSLKVLGRKREKIKVSGYLVDMNEVESNWCRTHPYWQEDVVVLDVPDARKENILVVVALRGLSKEKMEQAVEEWNLQRKSPEKIRHIYFVDQWPKTDLGKLSKPLLRRQLGF